MRIAPIFAALILASACSAGTIQPLGYFVMQPLHGNNPPLADSVLASPALAGVHLRDKWSLVEPTRTANSFTWLDGQLARARALNKKATLGIYAGTNSPAWLGVRKISGAPVPWDAGVVSSFTAMVADLGDHYRDNPTIAAVHMSSPATYESMEMHLAGGVYTASGYSDAKIIDVWRRSIDAYAAAFPSTALVLDLAMVPDSRGAVTFAVLDYAQATLGDRLNVIHCSLKASTNTNAPHHQAVLGAHAEGTRIGFEMVGPSNDARFGGTFSQAIAIGSAAGASWYQIYQYDVSKIATPSTRATPEPSSFAHLVIALVIAAHWRHTRKAQA